MPNYVQNRITFNSVEELREVFKTLLGNQYSPEYTEEDLANLFSFSLIVPFPKDEKECKEKFGEKFIYNTNQHIQQDSDRPWFNWYDWVPFGDVSGTPRIKMFMEIVYVFKHLGVFLMA